MFILTPKDPSIRQALLIVENESLHRYKFGFVYQFPYNQCIVWLEQRPNEERDLHRNGYKFISMGSQPINAEWFWRSPIELIQIWMKRKTNIASADHTHIFDVENRNGHTIGAYPMHHLHHHHRYYILYYYWIPTYYSATKFVFMSTYICCWSIMYAQVRSVFIIHFVFCGPSVCGAGCFSLFASCYIVFLLERECQFLSVETIKSESRNRCVFRFSPVC